MTVSFLRFCVVSERFWLRRYMWKEIYRQKRKNWEQLNNIFSRPLNNITKGPQWAVTGNFANSIQADMDFHHCLSPYCFIDQAVTSCMGSKIKGARFTLAHTETGVGASFTILNKEIKNCCVSTSSTGTRFFERCCHSPERFYRINASWYRWTTRVIYCLFSNVPAIWLIFHIFSLTPFYLWTLVHQQLLSGWDAATTTNQQTTIHTLDKYTFDVRQG